ncbi:DUF3883 domain-containing protein [Lederbergia citri]|uniref:DUF3883 domain-containing protein n=1 Tax=Lederbergia citri TaxID=2833580 RepID=A0A942TDR4_9BACI|nr:DUF3883 domain-containing protein [Lederbergia citri]MBS4195790.1 DUF3883 domain-containing protein [Lederbergia citri]
MAKKKEMLKNEEIEEILTKNSIEIIKKFLATYSKSSISTVRSSVYKLLYEELEKHEVADLTFNDYKSIIPEDDSEITTQIRLRSRFFQFLYAFDYLNNPGGFETKWIKDELIKEFSPKEKKSKKKSEKTGSLTVEELMLIQNVVEAESTKLETLKMQFCWYALFELGLPIEEVRKEITSDSYFNGQIKTTAGVFNIPVKFHRMFLELSNRDSNYNGFASLESLIANIGIDAGLTKRIVPNMIKNTRRTTTVMCPNCFESYSNEAHNWTSINNRIVCISCSESIKKKLKIQVNEKEIENTNVDLKTDKDISVLFTFEDLKSKLKSKKVDYLQLHEFQMEIGSLGEAYVYQKECERLKNTKYLHMIDERKAQDPANGYDILSYTEDGKPLHIEVKSTIGKEDVFHLSEHERLTGERMKNQGKSYVVYFVKEIMSDEPKLEIIENITLNENYIFETRNWLVSKKQSLRPELSKI